MNVGSDLFKQAASIPGAELNLEPPGYKKSPDEGQVCGNCKFYSPSGKCQAYNFTTRMSFVCDTWTPPEQLF